MSLGLGRTRAKAAAGSRKRTRHYDVLPLVKQLRRVRVSACLHFGHHGASRFSELCSPSNPHQSRTSRVVMAQAHLCPDCQSIDRYGADPEGSDTLSSTSANNATRFIGCPYERIGGSRRGARGRTARPPRESGLTKDVRGRLRRRAPDHLAVARRPHRRARVASGIRRSVSRSGGTRSPAVRWVPAPAWRGSTNGRTNRIQSTPPQRSSKRLLAPPPHRKGTET
jgi:hypothetical protein